MCAKIGEFMSTELRRYFLKIIWDLRKISVVSKIALYQVALYRSSCVLSKFTYYVPNHENVEVTSQISISNIIMHNYYIKLNLYVTE